MEQDFKMKQMVVFTINSTTYTEIISTGRIPYNIDYTLHKLLDNQNFIYNAGEYEIVKGNNPDTYFLRFYFFMSTGKAYKA